MSKTRDMFHSQRASSEARGIPFLLTYEEWLKIWVDSGHLNECGRRRGQYCMARYGDKGAYEVGNVRIVTSRENKVEFYESERGQEVFRKLQEAAKNPSEETRRKLGQAGKSKPKPAGFGAKISEARKKLLASGWRPVVSEETRKKISAYHKGRKKTSEHQAKINASLKAAWELKRLQKIGIQND